MKNVLSKEAFADWLDTQPADKKYDYWDAGRCVCAQYAATLGIIFVDEMLSSKFWRAMDGFAQGEPTFGALSARLRGA